MKKRFGFTFGGLHQKIISLVLTFMLILIGAFVAVTFYQNNKLSNVAEESSDEQEKSIKDVSEQTMHSVLENSMLLNTSQQAEIADSDLKEVANDVVVLRTMAEGLFKSKDHISPAKYSLPDPAKDGTPTAQVLYEEGVDYENSEYLGVAAHMTDAMLAMFNGSDKIKACYIGLADGTHLEVDADSGDRFDENGRQLPLQVRQRPWYKGAVQKGGLYFSGLETDAFTGDVLIFCSAPVIVNGELYGVVGMDIVLESMKGFVERKTDTGSFASIINEKGQVILAPEDNGIFALETSDKAEDLTRSSNSELAEFVTAALADETKLGIVNINGKAYYMACAPMKTIGWSVVTVIEKDITEMPANQMLVEYERINDKATSKYTKESENSRNTFLIIVALILILSSAAAVLVANRIVRPVEKMTRRIISLGNAESEDQVFRMEDAYKTGDEIEVLARSFADISEKTVKYIAEITRITAEKERIGAELDVAKQIQADMLPRIFPPYPERAEFDIYADMQPAKEVGGDFYDFFFIDEEHIALVMADVSGKGIPAALFMVIAKTLIKNRAQMGGTPAEILRDVNEQLCEGNDADMFVTVWLAVIDLRSGEGIAANAGHEFPAIYRAGGKFELVKNKHSPAVAVMEGMKFRENTFKLEPGDTLFVYTDGVPEATDIEQQMFGTDRMVEVLNNNINMPLQRIIDSMRSEIELFVDTAEQFDDITMLVFRYYGNDIKGE